MGIGRASGTLATTRRSWGLAALAAGAILAGIPASASAVTLPVACGDVTALRNAITTANTTAAPDTIDITGAPCNFNVPNAVATDSGLPIIIQPLTIEGHGATIRRTGATNYRLITASTPNFVAVPRVELRELTISGGRLTAANQHGGAVAGLLADLVLDRVVMSGNAVAGRGGAVSAVLGSLDMDRTIAAFNTAGFGGAISTSTTAGTNDITRSSIYLNSAAGNSGAMLLENGASLIENSTVAANAAPNGLGGVTAFTSAAGTPATLTVRSSTLGDNGSPNNTAPGTSLLALASAGTSTITATDTVVVDVDSSAPPVSAPCLEAGGTIVDGGSNVEFPTTSCDFPIEADPRVLYQFGGLLGSELFAKLQRDSAAIDVGGNDCPATDQRTQPRPAGVACDSGSYETQPPDTTAVGPTSPTADPQVTFTSSEPGSTFECRVDGGPWVTCTSPFDPDPLVDGSHTVDVRAIDADGDVDPTPASVTFVVDRTAPVVTIDPVASPTADPTVEITFTVTDDSAIDSTTCQVDAGPAVPCTSPFTTPALSEGPHSVTVEATDAAGNVGSDTVEFVVDLPAQTISAECHRSTILLGSHCFVTLTCPADNSGCTATGEVAVRANRLLGIVHGEVTVLTPDPAFGVPDRSAHAECGTPTVITNQCATATNPIVVDPGDTVRVTCTSDRNEFSLGLLALQLDCFGRLTTNVGV